MRYIPIHRGALLQVMISLYCFSCSIWFLRDRQYLLKALGSVYTMSTQLLPASKLNPLFSLHSRTEFASFQSYIQHKGLLLYFTQASFLSNAQDSYGYNIVTTKFIALLT